MEILTKFPISTDYVGRFLGIGFDPQAREVAAYEFGGRSEPSKKREVVIYPNEHKAVVEPLDKAKMVDPQRDFYPAMMTNEDGSIVVVTNGPHTKDIFKAYMDTMNSEGYPTRDILRDVLSDIGPEMDEPNWTPTIAGVIYDHQGISVFYLGVCVPLERGKREPWLAKTIRVKPDIGTMYGVSTYNGKEYDNGRPMPFDINEFTPLHVPKLKITEETPQELADALFGLTRNDLVAATLGAMRYREDDDWRIKPHNSWIKKDGEWVLGEE